MLGAERVIAIDRVPYRLEMARDGGAETINYEEVDDLIEVLKDMTGNIGPDSCIDAVGMEAYGHTFPYMLDRAKQVLRIQFDRPQVLRQAIQACRKGGTVSLAGVYGGMLDTIPFGASFAKGLTIRMGQTHVHRYMKPLLDRIRRGEIDPSFVVTHRLPLEDAPRAYRMFRAKDDDCVKVVLQP